MNKDSEELASIEYANTKTSVTDGAENVYDAQAKVLNEAASNAMATAQALGALLKQFGVPRQIRRQYMRDLMREAFRG